MGEAINSSSNEEPTFRIGAVCRLTGLSQHVLRIWEKRYDAVEPLRSDTDRRLYRQQDIDRLTLLKTLVDRGQAIGSIASLDNAELQKRIQQTSDSLHSHSPEKKPTLALIGEGLATWQQDCEESEVFTFSGCYASAEELIADQVVPGLDVAVIEWPTLQPGNSIEIIRLANQLNVRHLILVYDYASRAALKQLGRERFTALRAPLDAAALDAVIAWRLKGGNKAYSASDDMDASAPPPRQFSKRELVFLSGQSSAIDCECPMQLSQVLTKLYHFETYSAECESRNAEDAALHRYLYRTTSQARSMMEQALQRIVEIENLSMPTDK